MHRNSAELPCKDKKIILINPRNYDLEQPFRIQDSYARAKTYKQSYNQGDQSFISILDYP